MMTNMCATAVPAVLTRITGVFLAMTLDDWIAAGVLTLLMFATFVLCHTAGDVRRKHKDAIR